MDSNHKCSCSGDGFSEYMNDETGKPECALCHILCKSCEGPLSTNCDVCNEAIGAIYEDPKTCKCPSHQYFDPYIGNCEECNILCAECSGPTSKECDGCDPSIAYEVSDKKGWCVSNCDDLGEYFLDNNVCKRKVFLIFSLPF